MADDLPAPLTPPDCDLRDFQFMPLDVVRFAQSDLVALEDPAAVLANILLWGASWHSLPAGSLTDDDRVLARLAGYGRGISEWERVRSGALRGWIKCSDGRLYHPVVAEKALDAWMGKLRQRHRTLCAAVRKHNERNPDDKVEAPDFDTWNAGGRPLNVTRDKGGASRVTLDVVTPESASLSRSGHAEKRSKGQGQGQGQGQGDKYTSPSDSSISDDPPPPVDDPPALLPALIDQPDDAQIAFERHDALRREFVPGARAVTFTPDRRKKLVSRLKEIGGLQAWTDMLGIIRASPFLCGETSRNGFVPDIDWLTTPANLRKVMEGKYDEKSDRNSGRQPAAHGPRSAADAFREARSMLGIGRP